MKITTFYKKMLNIVSFIKKKNVEYSFNFIIKTLLIRITCNIFNWC